MPRVKLQRQGARDGGRTDAVRRPNELDIIDGEVVRRARGYRPFDHARRDRESIWRRPARRAASASRACSAEGWFVSNHMNYPYGVHAAVVKVDARNRRHRRVERYLVAYDIGRAINPMLVEGQIVGGLAQGIGGALLRGIHL